MDSGSTSTALSCNRGGKISLFAASSVASFKSRPASSIDLAIASASCRLSDFVQSTYSDTKKEPFSLTDVVNSLRADSSDDLTRTCVTNNTGSPETNSNTTDSFQATPTLFHRLKGSFQKGIFGLFCSGLFCSGAAMTTFMVAAEDLSSGAGISGLFFSNMIFWV